MTGTSAVTYKLMETPSGGDIFVPLPEQVS